MFLAYGTRYKVILLKPNRFLSDPAANYTDALARVRAMQALDDATINPICHTYLLAHGQRTPRVVVYLHGYTNCPAQFHTLAQHFHAAGDTVFVPRLPLHGYGDRMTRAHGRLTAAMLIATTNQAVDIACGLGDEVVVMGLSAGANLAAWAAHYRAEVDTVLVAAPSLGLPGWPLWASEVTTRLMRWLPNFFIWWDQKARAQIAGAPYAYPRFATHSLGEVVAVGRQVRQAARTRAPLARRLVVIQTAADAAVHQGLVAQLAADWKSHAPERVHFHTFPADQRIHHDMIDPTQPLQRVDLVYPVWLEMTRAGQTRPLPSQKTD